MKQLFLCLVSALLLESSEGQVGPAELLAGNQYVHYQHSLGNSIKPESRFGWQHIATLIKRYGSDNKQEALPMS